MATLAFAAAGAYVGTGIGGAFLGISAATLGQAAGVLVGSYLDNMLFGAGGQNSRTSGPRLKDFSVTGASEGSPIAQSYGRTQLSGQIIWATQLEEEIIVNKSKVDGGGKGTPSPTVTETTYNYYANFAVALCEGVIDGVTRIWVDGQELNLEDLTYTVHRGRINQSPDSFIESKEGAGNVPGYQGVAYVVFERMPLADYGNRIPQMMFEVTKSVVRGDDDTLEQYVTGVNLIPATGEFAYEPSVVTQQVKDSTTDETLEARIENGHMKNGRSDWENAIDQLGDTLPNVTRVCLVVSWFGTDLRAASCLIRPQVENDTKTTVPYSWRVAGLTRDTAVIMTQVGGGPAFGGTPDDGSVIRAIEDLKDRGFEVMFYPFILMDIPSTNVLPDPYSNNAATLGQSAYPWRGRITCSPAAGYTGTVDKTATAGTQIDTFYGDAQATDFGVDGSGNITFSGTPQWTYSRFILHYAQLCKLADGVEYFCIGSELVSLTQVRESASSYPFVDNLVDLAAEVAVLLPGADLGYAADWSEYHSHRPSDGSGDVYFNLDPLWTDANIDFIGIDNYLPMSDWRDGLDHLDGQNYDSIYSRDYLQSNIEGGEYYDWFYASSGNRDSQTRTNITDLAYGKPWVYRQKDIRNWWAEDHYNRPSGVESGSDTGWVAEGKPIVFTEFGVPAINKGANQPNVFVDPKSSESAYPHYSTGERDDSMLHAAFGAFFGYWGANNPASGVYSGNMIQHTYCWTWDARPYPIYPANDGVWSDAENWKTGHWLSGRAGGIYLPNLLTNLAEKYGLTSYDFSLAYGALDGFMIDQPMSMRSAIQSLVQAFQVDVLERGDSVKAVSRIEARSVIDVSYEELADDNGDNGPFTLTRTRETDLPSAVRMQFADPIRDYEMATVESRRQISISEVEDALQVPITIDFARAQQQVDKMLYTGWSGREVFNGSMMPNLLLLEPGDVFQLTCDDLNYFFRIDSITDGVGRQIVARSFDRSLTVGARASQRTKPVKGDESTMTPLVLFMDIPMMDSEDTEHRPYVTVFAKPWLGGAHVFRSRTGENYTRVANVEVRNQMAITTSTLNVGDPDVWDDVNSVQVILTHGTLSSYEDGTVLDGANLAAIETSTGWELFQFTTATLDAERTYTLSRLIRGRFGSEAEIETVAAGARVVFFHGEEDQLRIGRRELNQDLELLYGPASRAISDLSYASTTRTFTGVGLRPYSPVHPSWELSSGDYIISWIRRTRVGGLDGWGRRDVAWNEDVREFEVDILSGLTVVRTISVTNDTSITYTAAQQVTDSITAPFDVVIYQISDTYGRGTGRSATIG